MNIAREILPICDLDLLRSELILDPTRRGYGGLAAAWPGPEASEHREILACAIYDLLTIATLPAAHGGRISRADQIGLRAVSLTFIERVLDIA